MLGSDDATSSIPSAPSGYATNVTFSFTLYPLLLGYKDFNAGSLALINILKDSIQIPGDSQWDLLTSEIKQRLQLMRAGNDQSTRLLSLTEKVTETDFSNSGKPNPVHKSDRTLLSQGVLNLLHQTFDNAVAKSFALGIHATGTLSPISLPTPTPTANPTRVPTMATTSKTGISSFSDVTDAVSKMNTGSQVGIGVGLLAVIGFIVASIWYYRKKGRDKGRENDDDDDEEGNAEIEMNTQMNARMSQNYNQQQYSQHYQQQHDVSNPMQKKSEHEALHEYDLRESEMQAEAEFQAEQAKYEQQMLEYEAAKALYEQQQKELQYQQSTYNPMINDQAARRGSQLEIMQKQMSQTRMQEVSGRYLRAG